MLIDITLRRLPHTELGDMDDKTSLMWKRLEEILQFLELITENAN